MKTKVTGCFVQQRWLLVRAAQEDKNPKSSNRNPNIISSGMRVTTPAIMNSIFLEHVDVRFIYRTWHNRIVPPDISYWLVALETFLLSWLPSLHYHSRLWLYAAPKVKIFYTINFFQILVDEFRQFFSCRIQYELHYCINTVVPVPPVHCNPPLHTNY